jgi:pSer/pThr/pTyr-binding forkhead associated (FHA) protein
MPGAAAVIPNVSRVPAPPPLPAAQARTLSSAQVQAAAPVAAPRQLKIRYQGQSFLVNKDKFIIGRGKQSSDLTIKDPNVSRQHAMIEFDGVQYCIVDLGSTNGIEYQGQRVQRKILADGDVLRICDHELSFQYR